MAIVRTGESHWGTHYCGIIFMDDALENLTAEKIEGNKKLFEAQTASMYCNSQRRKAEAKKDNDNEGA